MPEPLPYPERLGRWPAVPGSSASPGSSSSTSTSDNPVTLAILRSPTAVVQLVGHEPLRRRAVVASAATPSASTSTSSRACRRCTGATAAVRRARRWPGVAAAQPGAGDGGAGLRADRLDELRRLLAGPDLERQRRRGRRHLQDFFTGLGLEPESALEAAFTVGLLGDDRLIVGGSTGSASTACSTSASNYSAQRARARASCTRSCRSRSPTSSPTTSRCSPTRARRSRYLISDPLGHGSRLLRHRQRGHQLQRDLRDTAIWYVQVGALVVGHVVGAHRSPTTAPSRSTTRRRPRPARSTGCSP